MCAFLPPLLSLWKSACFVQRRRKEKLLTVDLCQTYKRMITCCIRSLP